MDRDDADGLAPARGTEEPGDRRVSLTTGARLAEARAAAGRDLADVARETRVPLRHLMAIEADDHSALPALPYALGFVKNYARALGMDVEALAAQFRAETSLTPHVPSPPPPAPADTARLPSPGLAWGSLGLLLAVVVGLGLYGAGVFDPAPPPPPVMPAAVAEAPAPAPVTPPAAAVADPAPTAPAPAAPPSAVPAAPPAGYPTAGPVVLLAKEDVWVRIYDRATRRRAFMGVLAAGERFEVPAGSALTLRAGKAGALAVSVAGVALPPLGGPVQTIDGVLLTAPALAARFDPNAPPPPVSPSVLRRRRMPVQVPDMPAPAEAQTVPAPQPAISGA